MYLGSALDAALDKLTALPDPQSDGECGVQLMTIHKAKGLEFEVVIVPELQASGGRSRQGLLSWLERGLPALETEDEVTEFLVAPIPPKGVDRGKAKAWVDREIAKREKQEARRILYVAGTRAREELHLFARPEYKREASGALALVAPKGSLLETAWPAIQGEAQSQFESWAAGREADAGELTAIAAGAENLLEMAALARPAVLRRLPAHYVNWGREGEGVSDSAISGFGTELLYKRHEGGLLSRALGIAVHTVFEEMARLRAIEDWDATRAGVQKMRPRLIAQIRSVGIEPAQARRIAAMSVELADEASREAMAQWIMSPHADAASEVSWAGIAGKGIRSVRVDRVFRAGLEAGSEGDEAWWIVDYKTAHAEGLDSEKVLGGLRALFAPQLEAYARILRGLHGMDAVIRAGLYYARAKKFDWWAI